MKRITLAMALMLAASTIAVSPVTAGQGGTNRPFFESGAQTGWLQCLDETCSQFEFFLEGPNTGTHIGRGSMACQTSDFVCRRVTANGDILLSSFANAPILDSSDVPCRPDEFPGKDLEVFIGGSGRFAHATGSYEAATCASFGNEIGPGRFEFFLRYWDTGAISY